jgi:hypothetical protein
MTDEELEAALAEAEQLDRIEHEFARAKAAGAAHSPWR